MQLPPLVTSPRHWLFGPEFFAQHASLEWIPRWAGEHADIFRLKSPFGQATMVAAPELARQALVDHVR